MSLPPPPAGDRHEGESHSRIGSMLGSVFRIDERIGQGAMGVVYRAHHVLLDQDCAIKIVEHPALSGRHLRARLLREARALTDLRHPNIVHVLHLGEEEDVLYLAMDLVRGETLRSLLLREGALPPERAVRITSQILSGLTAAHAAGIVHRDLKPENVMLSGDAGDHVQLLDFGLARIMRPPEEQPPGSTLTAEGTAVGTVSYMSPEQVRATAQVGPASDLFSTGILLYEMLTGRVPFESDSVFSVMKRILEQPPPPLPAGLTSGVCAALRSVVARALEKQPEDRYEDAPSFRRALESALRAGAGEDDPARSSRGQRSVRRGVLVLAAAGVLALVLLALWRAGPDGADLRERARRLACSCHPQEAIEQYERLLRTNAATAADSLAVAELRTLQGIRAASRDIEAAERKLGADDPRVLTAWAGYAWWVQQDLGLAREHLGRALISHPGHLPALWLRAWLLIEMDPQVDLQAVGTDLAAMERHAPQDGRIAILRAQVAFKKVPNTVEPQEMKPSVEEALRLARDATHAAPRSPDAWLVYARALAGRAKLARRLGLGVEAVEYRESSLAAIEAGKELWERGTAEHCAPWVQIALLQLSVEQNDALDRLDDAVEAAREQARVRRDEIGAKKLSAWALRRAGRHAEAIPVYEDILVASFDQAALFDLAYCRFVLGLEALVDGHRDEATRELRVAVVHYSDLIRALAPRPTAPVYAYRGSTHYWLSRLAGTDAASHRREMLADMERANELGTYEAECQHRRALALASTGRITEAIDGLAGALARSTHWDTLGYRLRLAHLHVMRAWRALGEDDIAAAREDLAAARAETRRAANEDPALPAGVHALRAEVALQAFRLEAGEDAVYGPLVEEARGQVDLALAKEPGALLGVRLELLRAELELRARPDLAGTRTSLLEVIRLRRAAAAAGDAWLSLDYILALRDLLRDVGEAKTAALAARLADAVR